MEDTLRKFVAVVEAGSFTQAAESLHVSQPALSVAIKNLERDSGATLLTRTGRQGVALTEAGKVVYRAALDHRRIEQNLAVQLAAMRGQKVPLRIGMIDSVAALMCAQDEPFRTLEASTELSLHVLNSAALRHAVQRSELDVAVVIADDKEDDRFEVAATAFDVLLLVCAPHVHAAMRAALAAGEVLPFLSYTQQSATYAVIERALTRSHIRVDPLLYSTSPDTILAMVKRGRGVAALPELLVMESITRGLLVPLEVEESAYRIRRRLHVVTLKGRKLPPRLAGLAYAMREHLRIYTEPGGLTSDR